MLLSHCGVVIPHALFIAVRIHFKNFDTFFVHLQALIAGEHFSKVEVLAAFSVGVELDAPLDELPRFLDLLELE